MIIQPRRLRYNCLLREMLAEIKLNKNQFIQPLFIKAGKNIHHEIKSMPGIFQYSLDQLYPIMETYLKKGLNKFILFGLPSKKDLQGSDSLNETGIIAQSIRELKKRFPETFLISDICFCEYTSHGHCGILENQEVNNAKTIVGLAKQALIQVQAGVDMVAPSAMMDGMIQVIRKKLDENNYPTIPIMSYAVKFASAFYGPFREAAESTPQLGDRNSYQLNPTNLRESLREAFLDVEQGADIIMVKPGLAYLDVLSKLKSQLYVPLCAYQVSGEYSMIKAASQKGFIDEKKIVLETCLAFKRAGAQLIISYFSQDLVNWLK